jgi:hypothetical protein
LPKHEAAAEECGGVVREGAHRKPGKQSEGAIKQTDETSGEISSEGIAGNGELGDHPLCAGAKMGKNAIEEPLHLRSEKAVEKEVGNNQIIASAGIPFESIGGVQTNALAGLGAGAPNAAIEKLQHGVAGVDDIHGEGSIGRQQARQEASIAVP